VGLLLPQHAGLSVPRAAGLDRQPNGAWDWPARLGWSRGCHYRREPPLGWPGRSHGPYKGQCRHKADIPHRRQCPGTGTIAPTHIRPMPTSIATSNDGMRAGTGAKVCSEWGAIPQDERAHSRDRVDAAPQSIDLPSDHYVSKLSVGEWIAESPLCSRRADGGLGKPPEARLA